MRNAFLALTAFCLPQRITAACTSPLVNTALSLFNVSGLDALPNAILKPLQAKCAAGNCPTVATSCGNQSVDDIECEIPVFETGVKIGTDLVCNTACDDWPCKVACNGIDVAICDTTDVILCKVGCLGIRSCVEACEAALVDPCRQTLIDDCSSGCEATFQSCKESCDSVLTMEITGDLERLQNIISSLSIPEFDVDCHGDGVFKPLVFNASFVGSIGDLGLAIKIHTKDVGISSTNTINLDQLTASLHLPAAGNIQCGVRKNQKNINITFGDAALTDFDLDVNLQLDKALSTIAAVICLDLPFCKDAIQDGIDGAIKGLIMDTVPNAVAGLISPTLQSLVTGLTCPGSSEELDEEEPAIINV